MVKRDHYTVLGVSPSANEYEIGKAFGVRASLALIVDAEGIPTQVHGYRTSTEAITALDEAFNVLGNPATRKEYDAQRTEVPTTLPHHARAERGAYHDMRAETSGLEEQVSRASRQYRTQEVRQKEKEPDVPASAPSLAHRLYESTIGNLGALVQNLRVTRLKRRSIQILYQQAEQQIADGLFYSAEHTIGSARQLAEEHCMNVRPYETRVVRAIYAQVEQQVKRELYNTAEGNIDRAQRTASYQGIDTARFRKSVRRLAMQNIVELHKRGLHTTAAQRMEFVRALERTG